MLSFDDNLSMLRVATGISNQLRAAGHRKGNESHLYCVSTGNNLHICHLLVSSYQCCIILTQHIWLLPLCLNQKYCKSCTVKCVILTSKCTKICPLFVGQAPSLTATSLSRIRPGVGRVRKRRKKG